MADPLALTITGDSSSAQDAASSLAEAVQTAVTSINESLGSTAAPAAQMSDAVSSASTSAASSLNDLGTTTASMSSSFMDFFSNIVGGGTDALSGFGESIKGLGSTITEGFENPLGAAKEAITGLLEDMGPLGIGIAGVGAAVAATAAGMFELADSAAATGEDVLNFSRITGTSVDDVGALKYAADVAGTSLDGMQSMLVQMQRRMDATGPSADKFNAALADLGINAADFRAEDPTDRIVTLSTAMIAAQGSTTLMSDALSIMGRSGVSNISVLMKPIGDLIDQGKQFGEVWTDADLQNDEQFTIWKNTIIESLTQVKNEIGQGLVNAIVAAEHEWQTFAGHLANINPGLGAQQATPELKALADTYAALNETTDQTNARLAALTAGLKTSVEQGFTPTIQSSSDITKSFKALSDQSGMLGGNVETVNGKLVAIGGIIIDAGTKTDALGKAFNVLNSYGDTWQDTLQTLNGSIEQAVEYYIQLGAPLGDIATMYGLTATQVQAVKDQLNFENAVVTDTTKAHLDLQATMPGLIKGFDDMAGANQGFILETRNAEIPTLALKDAVSQLGGEVVDVFDTVQLQVGPGFDGYRIHTQAAKQATDEWGKSLQELSQIFAQLGKDIGGTLGGILDTISTVTKAMQTADKSTTTLEAGINAPGGMNLGQVASGAVGDVGAMVSATSGGGMGAVLGGAATGAEIGSIIPGIGTVVGGIVGGAVGAIRDLVSSITGPSQAELQSRADLSSFMAPFETTAGNQSTGIQGVEDQLTQVGENAQQAQTSMAALLNAKTPAAFAAAMVPVNAALQANLNTTNAVNSVQSLVSAYESAGHVIPQSMVATIKNLEAMPGLTAAEQTALQGLVDNATPNFASLASEAANLGISLGNLGPQFAQGNLDQQGAQLAQTFDDLTNAGGDMGGMLQGASAQFGDLVDQALSAGATLPASIQPYIDDLAQTGQLVDSAGNKITDISKLNFDNSDTQTGLDGMNTSLDTLQSTLTTGVPAALSALLNSIPNNPFQNWTPPPVPGPTTVPGAAGGIFASGAAGVATWFGEGGEPELGGPASFFQDIFQSMGAAGPLGLGLGAAGGGVPSIVVNVAGSVITEQNLATTIGDLLAAKFTHGSGTLLPSGVVG